MDDLTLLVTGLTGLDAATLGTYLLTLVSVATLAGLVAPWLEARLPAWEASAKATAHTHDDRAVRVAATVLHVLLAIVALSAWVVPRFALGLRAGREAKMLRALAALSEALSLETRK